MSDARMITTFAEYRARYYPEPHDGNEAKVRDAEIVGKEIASASLEVVRESVVENREPTPRLAKFEPTEATRSFREPMPYRDTEARRS